MDHELLGKYLNETASPEERKQVMHWLADERSDITVYHRLLDEAWGDFTTGEVMPAETDRQVLDNIKRNIRQKEIKMRWKGRVRTMVRSAGGIAACLAIVMLGSYIIRQSSRIKRTNVSSSLSPVWDTISNHTSHTKKIHMPDGTMIMLNPHSHITYNNEYNTSNRVVKLKGEAYFEVKHVAVRNRLQQSDSFHVHVGGLDLTVLGTRFNIKSRRQRTEVSLLEGSLRIVRTGSGAFVKTLKPGEAFVWDSAHLQLRAMERKAAASKSWTHDELELDGYSLREILNVLQDTYGYSITLQAPELAKKRK